MLCLLHLLKQLNFVLSHVVHGHNFILFKITIWQPIKKKSYYQATINILSISNYGCLYRSFSLPISCKIFPHLFVWTIKCQTKKKKGWKMCFILLPQIQRSSDYVFGPTGPKPNDIYFTTTNTKNDKEKQQRATALIKMDLWNLVNC